MKPIYCRARVGVGSELPATSLDSGKVDVDAPFNEREKVQSLMDGGLGARWGKRDEGDGWIAVVIIIVVVVVVVVVVIVVVVWKDHQDEDVVEDERRTWMFNSTLIFCV